MDLDPAAAQETPFAPGSPRRARVEALLLVALFLGLESVSALAGRDPERKLEHPLLSVLASGLVMLLPVVALSWRDRDWRRSLGVEPEPLGWVLRIGALGVALAYGLNIAVFLTFVALHGGLKELMAQRSSWMAKLSDVPAVAIVPMVLFAGLWEELVFRGFLLGRLRASVPVAPGSERAVWRDVVAVAASASFFAAGHVYQGALGVLQTLVVGVAFGGLTVWSRSLWPAIAAHAAIDGFGLFALKILKPMMERVVHGSLPT